MKQTKRAMRGIWLAAGAVTMTVAGCSGKSGGGGGILSGGSGGGNVATVAGQAITRGELQGYAEAKVGEQALSELIDYNLLMAELKSKGLDVSEKEVEEDLATRLREADPATKKQIERMMAQGGSVKDALERQARLRMAIEKIVTKDIKVSDAELKAWFEKNKEKYYPERVKLAMLMSSQKPRADAMARQLTAKDKTAKTFQQLVDEQGKIADPVGRGSTMQTPLIGMAEMPPFLRTAISKLKPGQVSPVLEMKPSLPPGMKNPPKVPPAYVIARLEERQGTTFESARASLEQDYKLEQLARREQKNEPQLSQMSFDQAMMQVRSSLPPSTSPSDMWRAFTRTAEQKIITDLRQKGTVKIDDAFYAELAANYRPAPLPGAIMPAPDGAPAGGAPAGGAPSGPPPSAPAAADHPDHPGHENH